MSFASKVLNQVRNPSGWLGRQNLKSMNRRHSKLTDWGLEHVSINDYARILDIGCGGGRTISKLAAIATRGKVYGVDHSETSVDTSKKYNRLWIQTGRVEIKQGSVSHLPFQDQMFDLATAVENHFYWPDLPSDMREVLRVLKPGGALIVIAEVYKGGKFDRQVQKFAEMMKRMDYSYANLDVDEHRELFLNAGFIDVQVTEEYDKGWICALGKRPSV
ncbi:MAG TPA: methyltransferase domain-containing protein [Blastocatellia bacterium]|nr:methyltransferase domain-containing protein [Blastocatellia bacterium]